MFSPVPMLQVSALVLERDQRAVLKDWGRFGSVQLLPPPANLEVPGLGAADNAAKLAQCERLLSGIEALRQSLAIAALPQAAAEELTLDGAEQRLGAWEAQAGAALQRRERLHRRWAELQAVSAQVSAYCGLDLPLEEPGGFAFLHFVTGSLPAARLEGLQLGDKVAVLPLTADQRPREVRSHMAALGRETHSNQKTGRQRLVAVTTHEKGRALEQALARAGFEPERLPVAAGQTADTLSETNRREQASVQVELEQVNERIRSLANEVAPRLAALTRAVNAERCMLAAEQSVPRTEAAVVLSGWVPASAAPALERRLRQITANRCVLETATAEQTPEEKVPVLLHHSKLLRPFELLVTSYGLPQYRELEPTLFVALSFLLMFGMMFGDVGHGAVLALGGILGWRLGRSAKLRDAGLLLLFGGLASMLFGLVYGSYFGLPGLKRLALWHDPLEGEPLSLMLGALGVGVVLLSLGLVLNVANHFRHRDYLGGFLDKFGLLGVLFYWGMLAFITNYTAVQSRGWVHQALLLCFVLPILGWTLKGPLESVRRQRHLPAGLGLATAESLVEAFEGLLSYLANTISFVRLAAYALSHAALLAATFLLAAQVHQASAAASVLVIILGNLVAIVLEGVVASVQALRLEYYEFFSKFFSGAGQAFKPFQLVT